MLWYNTGMKNKNTIIGFRAQEFLKTDLNSIAFEYGISLSELVSLLVWMHLTSSPGGDRVILKDETAKRLRLMLDARIEVDRRV